MEAILTVTRCVFLVCAWICISLWVMGTLLKNIASPQGDLTTDQSDVSIHERNSKPPYPGDTDKHLHIFVQVFTLTMLKYLCMNHGNQSVFYPVATFRFRSRSRKPMGGFLLYCTHTSLRGCRCAFGGLWTLTYLNGRPLAIINFNVPDIWRTVPDSYSTTLKQNVWFQGGIFPKECPTSSD